jgi:hypothetical protein
LITVHCPCGWSFAVADAHVGKRVRCKHCSAMNAIGQPDRLPYLDANPEPPLIHPMRAPYDPDFDAPTRVARRKRRADSLNVIDERPLPPPVPMPPLVDPSRLSHTPLNRSDAIRELRRTLRMLIQRPLRLGGVVALSFAASWLVSWIFAILVSPVAPALDSDTSAYLLMLEGLKSGRYAHARQYCQRAYSATSDPDLRYLCDLQSRISDLALKSDIESFDEANSLSGGLKGVTAGFFNPLLGLSAIALGVETAFTDLKAIGERVDSRYEPQIRAYLDAEQLRQQTLTQSSWLFWLSLPVSIAGMCVGACLALNADLRLYSRASIASMFRSFPYGSGSARRGDSVWGGDKRWRERLSRWQEPLS